MHPLQEQYNKLIAVENEIGDWLDNPGVPNEDKEPYIPKYQALVKKLNGLLNQMKAQGLYYTDSEALHGFFKESD